MAGGAPRIAKLAAMLLLALPVPAWAGSSQATLSVGAVVAPRCAVRTPGSLTSRDLLATGEGNTVAMRCTKGTLPSSSSMGAAAPRITRTMLPGSAPAPRAETAALATPEAGAPRLVITVNF